MSLKRREFVAGTAAVAAGGALAVGAAGTAQAKESGDCEHQPKTWSFTVLGTTDIHGHAVNWDYYTDATYKDKAGNTVGLARVATLVKQIREEVGHERCVLIDAGDIIQGTPLAYYYARVEPITEGGRTAPKHPMALAMNAMKYDAAALGNHEFNYGIDTVRAFERQCDFPLLAANAIDAKTNRPAFPPYLIKRLRTPHGPDIKLGILGLTNPGIAIWDKDNVSGKMTFNGIPEQAAVYVPRVKSAGADIVVVSAHSGIDEATSWGDQLPYGEDVCGQVAANVPDIDAILVGHTHKEVAQRLIANTTTGKNVVLSEPYCWGFRLSRFDFEVELVHGEWQVTSCTSSVLNSNTVDADPYISELVEAEHEAVRTYVNAAIGTCTEDLSIARAPFQCTPIIDLIGKVQQDTVAAALVGTSYASLPVLAQAAPFNRTADLPAGTVRWRDAAGLYIYDNTLEAKLVTGAQLRDYLEFTAQYFNTLAVGATLDESKLTNANNRPDYNFDEIYGLSYDIDVSQPVGSRILNVKYNGADLVDTQQFVLAVNNYRANGGGNFPHVADAQLVWSSSAEIRNTMISWVQAKGEINPKDFFLNGWKLVRAGVPLY